MSTRNKLQTITLSIVVFALLSLPFTVLKAQVKTGGDVQVLAKSIPGLDIIVKKTPGSNAMRYAVSADGKFSLGTLPEGIYTMTLSFSAPANAKTYFESRSNTTRSVTVNGIKDGTMSVVWDPRQNQLFEINNLAFKPVRELTFEVTEFQEITGNIAAFGPKDFPNVQTN